MEKPTYTAIDYNSKENKVIEERIRNYYLPVKNTFEAGLPGILGLWLLCVCMCGCGVLVCLYHESLKFPGTKRAERLR